MTQQLGEDYRAHHLALLIKAAPAGRSWCSTRPITIARYLLAHGVTVPIPDPDPRPRPRDPNVFLRSPYVGTLGEGEDQ